MLLHAFFARAGAGTVLAAAGGRRQPGDAALLSAVSMCFALGAATTEQFKHLAAAEAGPLAGLGALPGLRALRPRLAAIADARRPAGGCSAMFASAMLAADPVTSGVYYVDDHFVPYAGAKPVAKGWNNKRGRAERGPRGHPRHRARRAGGVLRDRGAVRAERHAAEGAGGAEEGRRAGREDHARVRPRRRLPAGVPALPRAGRALGHLPAGAAGRPGHAAGHHHDHRRRPDPADRLGRGESAAQGLRRGPADHPVRARPGRAADPDL